MKDISFLALAVLLVGACVEDDCPGAADRALYWATTERDLEQRATENSPSVRWYWCEAPLRQGDPVPEGKSGPIVNLADGSEFGYGGWVRVYADDLSLLAANLITTGAVDGVASPDELKMPQAHPYMWTWAAVAKFAYNWSSDLQNPGESSVSLSGDGAVSFASVIKKDRGFPLGIRCYTVSWMQRHGEGWLQCREPAKSSPVTKAGGSGSASSAGTGGPTGDWGPN